MRSKPLPLQSRGGGHRIFAAPRANGREAQEADAASCRASSAARVTSVEPRTCSPACGRLRSDLGLARRLQSSPPTHEPPRTHPLGVSPTVKRGPKPEQSKPINADSMGIGHRKCRCVLQSHGTQETSTVRELIPNCTRSYRRGFISSFVACSRGRCYSRT